MKKEKSKRYVNLVRKSFVHDTCGYTIKLGSSIAEICAMDPSLFYGYIYCCICKKLLPVSEFKWIDGETVGN